MKGEFSPSQSLRRQVKEKAPWPITTVTIIAILFTPAVGGIIAAVNQRRFGFKKKSGKEYAMAALSFLLYSFYLSLTFYSVLGYRLTIPIPILIPIFILVTWIFFL